MIGAVLFATFVGIPLAVAIWLGVGIWVIYRIARGWVALRDRKPMYITDDCTSYFCSASRWCMAPSRHLR
jgi:uncharacterized membrane protein